MVFFSWLAGFLVSDTPECRPRYNDNVFFAAMDLRITMLLLFQGARCRRFFLTSQGAHNLAE